MRVLITGGAGFIGFHLARAHLSRGDAVVLIDNLLKTQGAQDPELAQLLAHPAVRLIRHDLTQPLPAEISLREISASAARPHIPRPEAGDVTFDIVYHLAAINGTQLFYDIPYEVARTNVLATIHLLDWLAPRQIGRLLYSSSSEVYAGAVAIGHCPMPTDEQVPVVFTQPTHVRFSYGASKFMGEVLCTQFGRRSGIPCTIVRYHNVYGPRMGERHVIPEFIARARRKEDPFDVYGSAETRAFCYIDDAVEATVRVATLPSCADEIIHIGNSREEIRIVDLARMVMSLTGHQAESRERPSRGGSVSRRCPNTAKLKWLTGFEAGVSLRDGIARMLAWDQASRDEGSGSRAAPAGGAAAR